MKRDLVAPEVNRNPNLNQIVKNINCDLMLKRSPADKYRQVVIPAEAEIQKDTGCPG